MVCAKTNKGQVLGQIIDRAVHDHVTGKTAIKSRKRQVGVIKGRAHEVGDKD